MMNWIRSNRGFLVFLLLFGLFRTAVADWNPIPSGSMRPNLLEGDVVFVNRLAYDLKLPLTDIILARTGEPQRGDIITFSSPRDGTRLIKRVIGLPGDMVEMRDERLFINGQEAQYAALGSVQEPLGHGASTQALRLTEKIGQESHRIQWLEGIAAMDNFGPLRIPADQFLMLGDNRDNSADSRYIGLVPRRLLIGHAVRILVSADILGNWSPRFGRFGLSLD
ncbi:MAG: signal peptidase I [Betaproteobacteria bacterium]|nr:signal peptidase I [Betaproteobacteria bacterium]